MKSIKQIEIEYNIKIISARITGRRWTCVSNDFSNIIPSRPGRIQIDSSKGFIIYNWDTLDDIQKEKVKMNLVELEENEQKRLYNR
ncbi:MAG: hypothetical protein GXY77_05830 [Fibrobacter sp.]|nr:hypothetical protein [Fibrobacter sp.]